MSTNVLFIGLGVMGYPMAAHLSKHCQLHVYNRSKEKVVRWLEDFNGQALNDLVNIDRSFDIIITCIGNDKDLEEVYLSENGLMSHCKPGTLLIDHTTASAELARKLGARAEQHELAFVDAPVSGGEQGAIKGQLTIMCGGAKQDFDKATELMQHYAKAMNLLGPSGSGQLCKMANQMAVAGIVQGLAEAIHFSEQADLDCKQVIDVISKGAAQSWQMDNRSETMIEAQYNHGFAVDWMRKDLNICLAEARNIGAKLPLTALIDQFYGDIQDMGGARWDTSSLLERLRK